jgi:4,5-DOPA dioxygenase extradiol
MIPIANEKTTSNVDNSITMPVIFAGHGSPLNAIELNEFSRTWQELGISLPHPAAILCISAHWETKGTFVTAMHTPRTIHDFGGFPKALYDVLYPAPGAPELACKIASSLSTTQVRLDQNWGLDHGAWSVIKNMYPNADIPVVQLSLDYGMNPQEHYELGLQLAGFRREEVLIIGSGNLVHNLRLLEWTNPEDATEWAMDANELFKKLILKRDYKSLIEYKTLGKAVQLAVPTPEHYLPLLYALALQMDEEESHFFNDKVVMGSLSMTSVWIGNPTY